MTRAHRRYVRVEMAVSAAINAVLSLVFVGLVFGGDGRVAVGRLVVDAVPQTLMVALMSMLVPTLLTRRRVAAGALSRREGATHLPRHVVLRSLSVAVPLAIVAVGLHALLLPLTGATWPLAALVAYKAIYGALLGASVARVAVLAALRD